ncbi:hypothetical protein AKO1_009929 [Acrasis kona]|uniref:Phosphodiesterase n=1 Tax=Acrasis kona TaxID=1008807 RepID=A0AAW2ZN01_9EUKA
MLDIIAQNDDNKISDSPIEDIWDDYYQAFRTEIFYPSNALDSLISVSHLYDSDSSVLVTFILRLPNERRDYRKLSFVLTAQHNHNSVLNMITNSMLESYQSILFNTQKTTKPTEKINVHPKRNSCIQQPQSYTSYINNRVLAPANGERFDHSRYSHRTDELMTDIESDDGSDDDDEIATPLAAESNKSLWSLSSFTSSNSASRTISQNTPLMQAITELDSVASTLESNKKTKKQAKKVRNAINVLSNNSTNLLSVPDTDTIVNTQMKHKSAQRYLDDEVSEFLRQSFTKAPENIVKIPGVKGRPTLKAVATMIRAGTMMRKMITTNSAENYVEDEVTLKHLRSLHQWDFDVFKLSQLTKGRPLYSVVYHMFLKYKLFENLPISRSKFHKFMKELEENYGSNPYHNSTHAADVVHGTVYMMELCKISMYCTPEEILGVILGAACHDFRHPGLTNFFLIKTNDKLSIRYNDKSILESFHLTSTFKLLKNNSCNVLGDLTEEQYRNVRSLMCDLVLATDLAEHQQSLSAFKATFDLKFKDEKIKNDLALIYGTRPDRIMVLKICIKMADVGNAAKPLPLHLTWVKRIMTEFVNMGDREKELGVPISPFCNREAMNVGKCQLGFADFIVMPMFTLFSEYFPEATKCIDIIKGIRSFWLDHPDITEIMYIDELINEQFDEEQDDSIYHNGNISVVRSPTTIAVPVNFE